MKNFIILLSLVLSIYAFSQSNSDLFEAVKKGDLQKVKELISSGKVDINAKTMDRWTPLIYAAEKGHKEICEFLISNGAEINAKNRFACTALWYAARNKHKDVCELLISKGAEINVKDRYFETPLMGAAMAGSKEICELLISKGADLSIKNRDGLTAADLARKNGFEDLAKFLEDAAKKSTNQK